MKTVWIVGILFLLAVASVSAYGMWQIDRPNGQRSGNIFQPGSMHEQMEPIMEEGTYADLVKFREEVGFTMMPWVQDEETFRQAQERHEQMERWHEVNGYGHGGCHGRR